MSGDIHLTCNFNKIVITTWLFCFQEISSKTAQRVSNERSGKGKSGTWSHGKTLSNKKWRSGLIHVSESSGTMSVCAGGEERSDEGAAGPERGAQSAAGRAGQIQRMWPRSHRGDEWVHTQHRAGRHDHRSRATEPPPTWTRAPAMGNPLFPLSTAWDVRAARNRSSQASRHTKTMLAASHMKPVTSWM